MPRVLGPHTTAQLQSSRKRSQRVQCGLRIALSKHNDVPPPQAIITVHRGELPRGRISLEIGPDAGPIGIAVRAADYLLYPAIMKVNARSEFHIEPFARLSRLPPFDGGRIVMHFTIVHSFLPFQPEGAPMNRVSLCAIVCGLLMAGCFEETTTTEVIEKYPNDSKKKEITFVGNRSKLTRVVYYFENGGIKSDQHLAAGKPDSLTTIYYANGNKYKQTSYTAGQKNGAEMSWYENGQMQATATYAMDAPVGNAVMLYPTGDTASIVTFVNGQKEGEEKEWYQDGKPKSITPYRAGSMHGIARQWYDNGNKSRETSYNAGIQDGLTVKYHKNGKKEEEINYRNGQVHGLETYWNDKGLKMSEATYFDGVMESGQVF